MWQRTNVQNHVYASEHRRHMLIVECCILAMDCELVLENSSSAVVYTLSNTTI